MKLILYRKRIRVFCIAFLLSCTYTSQLSPVAGAVIGNLCWYTFDTLVKIWSSGLATDLCHRIHDLRTREKLLRDCIAYIEAQRSAQSAASHSTTEEKNTTPQTTTTDTLPSIKHQEAFGTLTSTPVSTHPTDFGIYSVDAADQFLKQGEIFDADTGERITLYHDERGDFGLYTTTGNTNIRIGTTAASVFNLIQALGNWLCSADNDTTQEYNSYKAPPKTTSIDQETLRIGLLRILKKSWAHRVLRWNDEYLYSKAEILQAEMLVQEKILKKCIAYLIIVAPEHREKFTEAHRRTACYIEALNAELAIIAQEKETRAEKQRASQKNQAHCTTSSTPPINGPKKDDEKEKAHPYGTYKDAPYHHAQSGGKKSPAPKNGQFALDNSLEIGDTTSRRIGIENDYFVIFDQTKTTSTSNPAEFHGHIRTWEELTDAMQAILRKKGWVNAKGKIL